MNALRSGGGRTDEVPRDALRSYYVDFYLAPMNNGGFSQFVFNSKWNPEVQSCVREGFAEMGARRHAKLFEREAKAVDDLGSFGLHAFLTTAYFGANPLRDALNAAGTLRCDR